MIGQGGSKPSVPLPVGETSGSPSRALFPRWLVDGRGCTTPLRVGDLKLAAGVGAWIGPTQFWMVFIATAIVIETCVGLISNGENSR